MGNLKMPVIIIVFVLTLAALLLGQHFIFRQRTLNNLEAQFAILPGIEDVTISPESEGLSLVVHMGQETGLKSTYDRLLGLAKKAGIPPHRIILQDNRGPILSQALYDIHYAIARGITVGEFPSMAMDVEAILDAQGIENREIWVEKEFVYLEMHYGTEHLYQVFSRDPVMTQSPELTRGSIWGEG
ncbi:MAG: hypothetical protein GX986_11175 [Firmicutes bacterium]|nr:hypothetical protein [Bacillota bacterium]